MSNKDHKKGNTSGSHTTRVGDMLYKNGKCPWCGGAHLVKQTTPVLLPDGEKFPVLLLACEKCNRMDVQGTVDAVVIALLMTVSHFMEKALTMQKVLELGVQAGVSQEWEALAKETIEKEGCNG